MKLALVTSSLCVLLAGVESSSLAETPDTQNAHGRIFDPRHDVFGKSYAEWTAAWWRWVWAMPATHHPLLDPTGADCGRNQSGPVFFLGGGFESSTIERTCTVPHDKALFFPLVTTWAGDEAGTPPEDDLLISIVKESIDATTALTLVIDGHRIGDSPADLARYRTLAKFSFPVIDDPDNLLLVLFGADLRGETIDPAYSDGYSVLVKPLSRGCHTIHFAGALADGFALDVTYHLNVL